MAVALLGKLNKALKSSFDISDKLLFYKKNKKEAEVLKKLYEKAFAVVDMRPDSTIFSKTGQQDIDPTMENVYHCGIYDLSIEEQKYDYELTMSLVNVSCGTVVTRDVNWGSGSRSPVIFLEWVTRTTMPSLKSLVSSIGTDKDKLDSEIKSIIDNNNNNI